MMEMLKIVWEFLMDTGNELIPKKRYALLLGVILGLSAGWMLFG